MMMLRVVTLGLLALSFVAPAQVFGPFLRRRGDIDASSATALARSVCERAKARTDREKAEAIWRFFLTDGRFVEPGFWYHIAYWSYEEPGGELLDVSKLLNSYGFGLCYQIAPVLQAVWQAAGLHARVWFYRTHRRGSVLRRSVSLLRLRHARLHADRRDGRA